MSQFQPWGLLLGRLLLAYIFVLNGYGKIAGFAGTAKYMASKGMPLIEPLLVGTILIELVGGLMLAVGWKARWAAWAFFLWLIPVTFIFHAYWSVPPEQVMAQTIQFQKNLAIMGGMLYVAFMGPGRFSLDKS
ncbi:MAG TPA: DoxX family protein [Burkholderiales bacterium]|jgi:putative oxidoreductase|nr:DoxX family protein [Burkholderiales bacterium]